MSPQKRKKKMVTFTIDPEVIEQLDAWLQSQELPPAKNAVFEAALRAFLKDRMSSPKGKGGD